MRSFRFWFCATGVTGAAVVALSAVTSAPSPAAQHTASVVPSLAVAGPALRSAGHSEARFRSLSTGAVVAQDTGAQDPVMRLQEKLEAGTVTLAHDSLLGYLPALLKAFDIPVSSQTLVFSRTSLQTDKITPWSPRALYFNDDVYIGYVFDSDFLEIAAVHPTAGARFYTFGQGAREAPRFSRETTTCLMCHQSRSVTGGVPGFMVLSTLTDRYGYPITGVHEGATTDATPVRQRFGGWYVTGTHGTMGHSGNVYSPLLGHQVANKAQYRSQFDMRSQSSLTDLSGKFDSTYYLTTQSDIVAIMVLTHQTIMHNLITATHEAAREALLEAAIATPEMRKAGPIVSPRLRGAVETLVRGMLFVNEAPLEGPMRGTTRFAEEFMAHGPRDTQGRSLRELDLERRLFKYRLSFLIHSEAFDALPELAKRAVYARLYGILNGTDRTPDLQGISAEDRRNVLEILTATKPEFVKLREP